MGKICLLPTVTLGAHWFLPRMAGFWPFPMATWAARVAPVQVVAVPAPAPPVEPLAAQAEAKPIPETQPPSPSLPHPAGKLDPLPPLGVQSVAGRLEGCPDGVPLFSPWQAWAGMSRGPHCQGAAAMCQRR